MLAAEQTLFSVVLRQVQIEGKKIQAVIRVYAAMGGGWVSEADKLTGFKPDLSGSRK